MPDNGNEYTYEYLPSVRLVGGCDPNAISYSSYANRQMTRLYYNWNNPDHRVKPDPWLLKKSLTALPLQQTIEVTTGVSGWYRTGVQNDWGCSPYKQKQYQRCAFVYPGPGNLSWAAWPDWSLPLRLAIKDDVINLGATLAEYRQSVSMFGSAVTGVRDAVRAIRGLKKFKRRSLCSITSAHLIHDYGIAPLMSDMFDSIETLRLRLEQPIYKRYHFRQPLTVVKDHRTSTIPYGGPGSQSVFDTYFTGSQEVIAHVELDRDKASRFTLGNPAELLWEVTPLSFVVDWFIPIGDWLIALDAMKAVNSVNVSITRKRKCKTDSTIHVYDAAIYGGTYRPQVIKPLYEHRIHERVVSNSVPLPPLPRPKLSGSVNRLLNAVSLLVSMRGCKGVMPRFSRKDFGLS